MSRGLEGTLAELGLCDLLHLIARERRSGGLHVTVDGIAWRFALDAGRFTGVRCDAGAEHPPLEPTLLLLVRYRRGAFRLEPGLPDEPEGAQVGSIPADALAAAGEAELRRLADRLHASGGEASRPARDRFPAPGQLEGLEPDARAVFALVNGDRTVSELIVRSRLDPRDVLDALDALAARSLVRLARPGRRSPPPGSPRSPRMAERWRGPGVAWRDGVAAALPLTLLLGWLLLSGTALSTGASEPFRIRADALSADPFQIPNDALAAARAAHEVERLRATVEAYRFAEGQLPERLVALVERGYMSAAALTDEHGRPYYYARRGDGFVLLAPER